MKNIFKDPIWMKSLGITIALYGFSLMAISNYFMIASARDLSMGNNSDLANSGFVGGAISMRLNTREMVALMCYINETTKSNDLNASATKAFQEADVFLNKVNTMKGK